MEQEQQLSSETESNVVESQESQTPEAPETLKSESIHDHFKAKTKELSAKPKLPGADPQVVVPPAFTPNWKYKVRDKEYEVPEYLRAAVKEEKHQKELIDMLTKAHGLDMVKPRLAETQKSYEDLNQKYSTLSNTLKDCAKLYQSNDFDTLFKELGIDEKRVFDWVVNKVNYEQLPQEQRQHIDARSQVEARLREQEKRFEQMQAQLNQREEDAVIYELGHAFSDPKVREFESKFDSQPGRNPGDLRVEILDRAELHFTRTGKNPRLADLVNQVMGLYGGAFRELEQPQPPVQQTPGVVTEKPKVIPNIKGKSTSPMGRRPKSLDELKKLAKEKYGDPANYLGDTIAT